VTVTERKQLTPIVSNKLSVACSKLCDIRIQSHSNTTTDKILVGSSRINLDYPPIT